MRRVLLDCDGVLADFIGSTLTLINGMFGSAFTTRDVKTFDFTQSLNLHKDDAARVKRAIGETAGFAAGLAVLPGAIEGVRRLREIADVYIVTSPWNSNPTWMSEREAWLKQHFSIPHSRVIHTSAKHLVCGDFLVDDKTETCQRWREKQRGVAVQWKTPHNRMDEWDGVSMGTWNELIEVAR